MTEPVTSRMTGPRVLVVEDDGVQAYLVTEALAGSGFSDIRVAATAHEAQRMLTSWVPDLVVLDLGLPDGDGMSILQLAGRRGPLQLPVLVVTGESDPERRVRALELGADDLVTKPFNLLELGVRAKRTLRAHDDLQAAAVLARTLADELAELSATLEEHLGVAVDVLLTALAMRSPTLGTRAKRVARSVHQLAVAVHLDDVAPHLGRAAACHEVGALALSDNDVAGVVVGERSAADRCARASEAILGQRHPLAAAAAQYRSPATSFDRMSNQLVAQLTAVAHVFHAAAGIDDLHPAAGVAALHAAVGLDADLVEVFLDVCVPAAIAAE